MSAHPEDACGHRRFEHAHDGCAVRQMYGLRYPCLCDAFTAENAAAASVDDRAFRPARVDPIAHGAARATGATLKAARRRKTLTKSEWERLQQRGDE